MASYGYSRVTDKGYLGFHTDLSEGAWGAIPLDPQLTAQQIVDKPLIKLPADLRWKLRATWTIQDLAAAAGSSLETVVDADRKWDSAERKLHLQSAFRLESDDPAIRAAAERVRNALLIGNGTEQTGWAHEREIDFGRSQVLLASADPLKSDIQLLDLGSIINEIATATEALAVARGRGHQAGTPLAPSIRIRKATAACSAAFNAIHEDLDWTIAHQAPGAEQDRLKALRAPLLALLARYPALAPAEAPTDEPPVTTSDEASTP